MFFFTSLKRNLTINKRQIFFVANKKQQSCFFRGQSPNNKKEKYTTRIESRKLSSSIDSFKNNSESYNKNPQTPKNCFWNQTFDKGRLKNFVLWFFLKYGEHKTVKLVEELKTIGFNYATKAGISLGIEDLKIPPKKTSLIYESENLSVSTIQQYKRGEITEVERFQRLIDTWHRTSEQLKIEVIENFETTDVLNPVYMMAFSGARGNISQVRQLVGMRGLMSNPQGQIIDFPIRSNFREGLTLTEYIISSYGARKGIVDTALRTANAGYLTRRLVDVAQHVIISSTDCGTNRGIFLTDMKEGNKTLYSLQNRLIGRVLARDIYNNQQIKIASKNTEISDELASLIARNQKKVFVRSALTCQTNKLVCQLCYGWSLAQGHLVSIGEAVGVVAAQSIGEPGTQLTMRTFHTGGVFSGNVSDQIKAAFDGIVVYKNPIAGKLIRTPEGKIAFLTKTEGSFSVYRLLDPQNDKLTSILLEKLCLDAKNIFLREKQNSSNDNKDSKSVSHLKVSELEKIEKRNFKIPFYTLLFLRNGEKVQNKQVIAQISSINRQKTVTDQAELTIKAEISGLFYSKNLEIEETKIGPILKDEIDDDPILDTINRAWNWGYAWILSGKIYQLPLSSSLFPIFGDFINKKTYMNSINWYVSGTFGSSFQLNQPFKSNVFNSNNLKKFRLDFTDKEDFSLSPRLDFTNSTGFSNKLTGGFVQQKLEQKSRSVVNKTNNFIENDFKLLKIDLISFELSNIIYKNIGYFLKLSEASSSFSNQAKSFSILQNSLETIKETASILTSRYFMFSNNEASRPAILSVNDNLFLFSSVFSKNRFSSQLNKDKNNLINPSNWKPSFNVFLNWFPKRFFTKTSGVIFFEPILLNTYNKFARVAKFKFSRKYISGTYNKGLYPIKAKNLLEQKSTSHSFYTKNNLSNYRSFINKKFIFPVFLKKDFVTEKLSKIEKKMSSGVSLKFKVGSEKIQTAGATPPKNNQQQTFNKLTQALIYEQYPKNLVSSPLIIDGPKKIPLGFYWKNTFQFNWAEPLKTINKKNILKKGKTQRNNGFERIFWISQPFYRIKAKKNKPVFLGGFAPANIEKPSKKFRGRSSREQVSLGFDPLLLKENYEAVQFGSMPSLIQFNRQGKIKIRPLKENYIQVTLPSQQTSLMSQTKGNDRHTHQLSISKHFSFRQQHSGVSRLKNDFIKLAPKKIQIDLKKATPSKIFKKEGFYKIKTFHIDLFKKLKNRKKGLNIKSMSSREKNYSIRTFFPLKKSILNLKSYCKITSLPYFFSKKTKYLLTQNILNKAQGRSPLNNQKISRAKLPKKTKALSKNQPTKSSSYYPMFGLDKPKKLFDFFFYCLFNKKTKKIQKTLTKAKKTRDLRFSSKYPKSLWFKKFIGLLKTKYLKTTFYKNSFKLYKLKKENSKQNNNYMLLNNKRLLQNWSRETLQMLAQRNIALSKYPLKKSNAGALPPKKEQVTKTQNIAQIEPYKVFEQKNKRITFNDLFHKMKQQKYKDICSPYLKEQLSSNGEEISYSKNTKYPAVDKNYSFFQRINKIENWLKKAIYFKKTSLKTFSSQKKKTNSLGKSAKKLLMPYKKGLLQNNNISESDKVLNLLLKPSWFYYTEDLSKFFLYNKKFLHPGKNIDSNFVFDRISVYIEIIPLTNNRTNVSNFYNPNKILLKRENWFSKSRLERGLFCSKKICNKKMSQQHNLLQNNSLGESSQIYIRKTILNKNSRFKVELSPTNTDNLCANKADYYNKDKQIKNKGYKQKDLNNVSSTSKKQVFIILIRKANEFKYFKDVDLKKEIYQLANQKNCGPVLYNLDKSKENVLRIFKKLPLIDSYSPAKMTDVREAHFMVKNTILSKKQKIGIKFLHLISNKLSSIGKYVSQVLSYSNVNIKDQTKSKKQKANITLKEKITVFRGLRPYETKNAGDEATAAIASDLQQKQNFVNKGYNSIRLYSHYKTGLFNKQKITTQIISKYKPSELKMISSLFLNSVFTKIAGLDPKKQKSIVISETKKLFIRSPFSRGELLEPCIIGENSSQSPLFLALQKTEAKHLRQKNSSSWGLPFFSITSLKSINLNPFILSYKAPYSLNYPFKTPMFFFSEQQQPTFLFKNPFKALSSSAKLDQQYSSSFKKVLSTYLLKTTEINKSSFFRGRSPRDPVKSIQSTFELGKVFSNLSSVFLLPIVDYSLVNDLPKSLPASIHTKPMQQGMKARNRNKAVPLGAKLQATNIFEKSIISNKISYLNKVNNKKFLFGMNGPILGTFNDHLAQKSTEKNENLFLTNQISLYKAEFLSFINNHVNSQFPFIKTYSYSYIEGELIYKKKKFSGLVPKKIKENSSISDKIYADLALLKKRKSRLSIKKIIRENFTNDFIGNKFVDHIDNSCMILTKTDQISFSFGERINLTVSENKSTKLKNENSVRNYKDIYFALENFKKRNQYVINDIIIDILNFLANSTENQYTETQESSNVMNLISKLTNNQDNSQIMSGVIELNKIPAGLSQQKSRLLLGEFLVYGDKIHPSFAVSKGGQIIHINNNKITLRKGQPIFISPQAILHKYDGDFIDEQSSVITLAYQQLKTGDIVQGIPKIEQFFEARTTKRGRLFRDSLENLLKALFNRYNSKLSREQAVRQSFYKIQQIIIDGVQRVYRSQGVTITDKHLEVIVKQMTSKVRITFGGSTGYLPGEICDLYDIEFLNRQIRPKIMYEPIVLGITKASLEVKSFLSAASFQQTTRVLTKAALSRKTDYLNGLKENVILGNLIPAGTGYLVYLDQCRGA